MKVKDLVKRLATLDQDAEVVLEGYEGGYVDIDARQIIQGVVYRGGEMLGSEGDTIYGPHLFSGEGRRADETDIQNAERVGIKPSPAVLLSRWFEG
jgi:hypothetical protein